MSRKIVWTEGLFISQHHFQAQDKYFENLVSTRVAWARRLAWGIREVEFDEVLLHTGQLGLRRLSVVWPDGLVVACDSRTADGMDDRLPEPRPFGPHFRGDDAFLDVFIGITHEGGGNVALSSEPMALARFTSETRSIADFNSGGAEQAIDLAVPNVRIVFGTERRERMATMPLTQLVRQSDGGIVLRDTFVPPVLSISAAPFLVSGLHRVVGALLARQRELAAGRKQRNAAAVEFHYTDARRFWLLHTLNSAIPLLSHYLATPDVHPEEVYLALASLAGSLSTFAPDADLSSIPRFNFGQLGDVFEQLFARVVSLLSVDAAPAYVEIPLERRPDGMFVGRIPEPRLGNHEFFVVVRSTLAEPVVRERVPQLVKIAGWRTIPDVVRQARHGVRVEIDWAPSTSLPVKPGSCFFRLVREGPIWEDIVKSATIAVYLPADGEWKDVGLSVYAIDPTHLR